MSKKNKMHISKVTETFPTVYMGGLVKTNTAIWLWGEGNTPLIEEKKHE